MRHRRAADLVAVDRDGEKMRRRLWTVSDRTAAASAVRTTGCGRVPGLSASYHTAGFFRSDFALRRGVLGREYMDDPQGRTLLLDFPITKGDAMQPAVSVNSSNGRRSLRSRVIKTRAVLDEFARLHGLRKIGDP